MKSSKASETLWGKRDQESLTKLGKEGSENHMVSKRKGRRPKEWDTGQELSKMEQWYEEVLGRCNTFASSNICCHSGLQRNLSNLSMTSLLSHLLVQVKRGPLNPMLMRRQESMQLRNKEI